MDSARELRHEFYDWLAANGLPEMGEQQKNRAHVRAFFDRYIAVVEEKNKALIKVLQRTAEERNAARKEKARRKMASKQAHANNPTKTA